MLNSQKLKEVCEVLNREDVDFSEAHLNIKVDSVKDVLKQYNFLTTDIDDFYISLTELGKQVRFFESKIAEIVELKLDGEMVLKAMFYVFEDVEDIVKKLEDMGYVRHTKYLNKFLSYNIYEGEDYTITIDIGKTIIVLSVKKNLDKKEYIRDYFLDLKECMTSLYNQII